MSRRARVAADDRQIFPTSDAISTLDGESQITPFAFIDTRAAVTDPFTDFMTGKLSERYAKEDRRIYAMMYFGITALIVLALVNLII